MGDEMKQFIGTHGMIDPSKVRNAVVTAIRSKVTVTADMPEQLPAASDHKGEVAESAGKFYISDGAEWVKNAVEAE